jgi:hypothetical protein
MKTNVCALALVALLFAPVIAQDETAKKEGTGEKAQAAAKEGAAKKKGEGKGKNSEGQEQLTASAELLKQLKSASLTEEQVAKIKELGKKHDGEISKIETDAKLTPELLAKQRKAMSSMKDSDLKRKDKVSAANKTAGLTEDQAEALAKSTTLRNKLRTEAIKLLTEEQKAKLPKAMTGNQGQSKGKKKAP